MQQTLQDFILDKIDDLKGLDSVVLDVRGKSSLTETMILCSGTSKRHINAIANHIASEAKQAGYTVLSSEAKRNGDMDWIVVDLNSVIVHILQEESRKVYDLENLWR